MPLSNKFTKFFIILTKPESSNHFFPQSGSMELFALKFSARCGFVPKLCPRWLSIPNIYQAAEDKVGKANFIYLA